MENEELDGATVGSAELLEFIKALPESESYVFKDEHKCCVTQEWLCGTFAGRLFVDDTYEKACSQMIEYLNRHIGHDSAVGYAVTESGWPDQKKVCVFLNAKIVKEGKD